LVSGTGFVSILLLEDLAMRNYDFSPLWRSTIGFDHLFDAFDQLQRSGVEDNFPPYNITRLGEDRYQISLALAGFRSEQIRLTAERNMLTVEGSRSEKTDQDFVYQGIAVRSFKRQFNLADYVQVKDAKYEDGLLKIELVREVPEAMKPREIPINGQLPNRPQLEAKAA